MRSESALRGGSRSTPTGASSSLVAAEPQPQTANVDERQPERDREDHHRQRRSVAEAQVLEDGAVRVERDWLRRRARATSGERVDEVEDPKRVERPKDQRDKDRRLEQRNRYVPEPPPRARAVDLRRLVEALI